MVILVVNLSGLRSSRETDAWRQLLVDVDFKGEVSCIEELNFGVWVISAEFGPTDAVRLWKSAAENQSLSQTPNVSMKRLVGARFQLCHCILNVRLPRDRVGLGDAPTALAPLTLRLVREHHGRGSQEPSRKFQIV